MTEWYTIGSLLQLLVIICKVNLNSILKENVINLCLSWDSAFYNLSSLVEAVLVQKAAQEAVVAVQTPVPVQDHQGVLAPVPVVQKAVLQQKGVKQGIGIV